MTVPDCTAKKNFPRSIRTLPKSRELLFVASELRRLVRNTHYKLLALCTNFTPLMATLQLSNPNPGSTSRFEDLWNPKWRNSQSGSPVCWTHEQRLSRNMPGRSSSRSPRHGLYNMIQDTFQRIFRILQRNLWQSRDKWDSDFGRWEDDARTSTESDIKNKILSLEKFGWVTLCRGPVANWYS